MVVGLDKSREPNSWQLQAKLVGIGEGVHPLVYSSGTWGSDDCRVSFARSDALYL